MPIPATRLLQSQQKSFLDDYTALARRLAADIAQVLARFTDADGIIPLRSLPQVRAQAQAIVLPVFVGSNDQPYADDGVTAQAEYPRLINRHVVSVTVGVVNAHRGWLQRNTPGDVFEWMARRPTGYRAGGPFRSNPLAQYDPFHKWVDPRGYTLSQRIWNIDGTGVGQRTLADIDRYLDDNIRRGTSALRMSRELETLMRPGARLKRTTRPYGTSTSYHGMVLARSEITRAHTDAMFTASLANPYTMGMEWALSAMHPKFDICDRLATIGMGGERLRDPYPIESAPRLVRDSHPQCICTEYASTGDIADTTAQIRRVMELRDAPPYVTPALVRDFAIGLLGTELLMSITEAMAA